MDHEGVEQDGNDRLARRDHRKAVVGRVLALAGGQRRQAAVGPAGEKGEPQDRHQGRKAGLPAGQAGIRRRLVGGVDHDRHDKIYEIGVHRGQSRDGAGRRGR